MDKKEITLLESSGIGCFKTYSYENYVAYCREMEDTPNAEDSNDYWEWVNNMAGNDYEDFFDNLESSKNNSGSFMITFNLGRWNGRTQGYEAKIYHNLSEAIHKALNSSRDYLDYKISWEDGNVVVYGYHHDGTNIMTIKKLSAHGLKNLDCKDEPNFEKYVQLKDTFKRIKQNFLWD